MGCIFIFCRINVMTKDLKGGKTCIQYLQPRADMCQKFRVMGTASFKP